MKKVFAASKSSFGAEFYSTFDTLDELKRGIVLHELRWYPLENGEKYTPEMYTEELFAEHSEAYRLFEIDLHDDEYLEFDQYDGQSGFDIRKKDPNILSICKQVE